MFAPFFGALQMPVLIGRTFSSKEGRPGDEPVAVMSVYHTRFLGQFI